VTLELSKSSLKKELYLGLQQCRAQTLALFEDMDEATFKNQAHPDFSPVGWHLGHIAYTESLWLLEHSTAKSSLFGQYRKLFAADGLPKSERVQLPKLAEILDSLNAVRRQVLEYLEVADLDKQERLWRFLLQHESQHCEIVSFVLELASSKKGLEYCPLPLPLSSSPISEMLQIPAGEFQMGSDSIDALDNEKPRHKVYLDTYYIDRYPVTCGQYRVFMDAGGYEQPDFWSPSGWEWLQTERVKKPLYWHDAPAWDNHPVCGVSWYEAEAYARFVGKRLPTEAEWEKAASWDSQDHHSRIYPWGDKEPIDKYCNCAALGKGLMSKTTPVDAYPNGQSAYGLYDALGNVWEWTASWFNGYPGFQSYPYVGYSQVYFDGQHRILKGGSWVTRGWALRSSFRNWYYPEVRQLFAGFRCAASKDESRNGWSWLRTT
jgi:ergothioneine biosynthesis protein EgtB